MRIGNIQLPPIPGVERASVSRRVDAADRPSSSGPLENTTDLLALSSGLSLRLTGAVAEPERQALLESISKAWAAGTYRPNPDRLASKLIDWGFDQSSTALP